MIAFRGGVLNLGSLLIALVEVNEGILKKLDAIVIWSVSANGQVD